MLGFAKAQFLNSVSVFLFALGSFHQRCVWKIAQRWKTFAMTLQEKKVFNNNNVCNAFQILTLTFISELFHKVY